MFHLRAQGNTLLAARGARRHEAVRVLSVKYHRLATIQAKSYVTAASLSLADVGGSRDEQFQEFAVDPWRPQRGFAADIVRIKLRTDRLRCGRNLLTVATAARPDAAASTISPPAPVFVSMMSLPAVSTKSSLCVGSNFPTADGTSINQIEGSRSGTAKLSQSLVPEPPGSSAVLARSSGDRQAHVQCEFV